MAFSIKADDVVAMVGDSITAPAPDADYFTYYGINLSGTHYWTQFANALAAYFNVIAGRAPTFVNSGHTGAGMVDELIVGGAKIGGGNYGAGTEPITGLPYYQALVTRWNATKVVSLVGVNDARNTGDGDTTWDRAEFEARYESFIDNTGLPGASFLLVSPWLFSGAKPASANPHYVVMDDCEAAVQAVAVAKGCDFLDVRAAYFADDAADTSLLAGGAGAHPSAKGAAWLCSQLVGAVTIDNSVRLFQ